MKRVISAIILILVVAAILILGNVYVVDVACSILAILALREYFNSNKNATKNVGARMLSYLASIYICFLHVIPIQITLILLVAFVPVCVSMLTLTVIFSNMKINFGDVLMELFGICYIVVFISFIPLLYGMPNGKITIWYLLLAAWGSDIFAYFLGCKFGKHQFTKISPNKSIEGCIAGVVGCIIFMLGYTAIINTFMNGTIPYWYAILLGVVLSFFAQCGDLAASSIKRYYDIKDFGSLIPGHGGVLDRIDSIIFMAPVAYILLFFI